jgi:predicted enzyme related to lactoylglutathione lyase
MQGRFAWHELMTSDTKAATRFYSELLSWKVNEMPMGPGGTYTLFKQGDKEVAGMMASPQAGIPSHWLTYIGVEDVDASVKKITELGGKMLVPPTDVPGMLRFAVAQDPQGAAFGILRGVGPRSNDAPYEGPAIAGTFTWDELHTKDQQAAGKFYGALCGWTGKVADNDPMKYWHWMHNGKDIGGMMTLQMPNVPPNWLPYIAVSDVDATTTRSKQLGGKVLMDPMEIPGTGRFAVLQDPTGAAFALFKAAPRT